MDITSVSDPRDPEAAAPLTPTTFGHWHAYIKPKPDELRWTAIPWETDLWAARLKAERQGKPIFLWAMNGNPLGCV